MTLTATDASHMSVSENACTTNWEVYQQAKALPLASTVEGGRTIAVRFKDPAGNVSPCLTQTIYFDADAPQLLASAIQVNYGAASTSNGTVTVSFNVAGATELKVSEDSQPGRCRLVALHPSRTFTLSAGNGTKTVYAIFRDGANNQTVAVNDTIVLDTTPISIPFVTIQADVTSSTTVTVNLAASNIDDMWLSESSTFATGAWEPYVGTKNVTFTAGDGVKTLYAKFKKTSGAESVVVSDTLHPRYGWTDPSERAREQRRSGRQQCNRYAESVGCGRHERTRGIPLEHHQRFRFDPGHRISVQ